MSAVQQTLSVETDGKGTYEITGKIAAAVRESKLRNGLVNIFCRHTSCSLVIMENADYSAREDLHAFLERLVPRDDPRYTHTIEGPDDATSHIKMALTRTSETIPLRDGEMDLGTWQGIFLWEHRDRPHRRSVVVTCLG
ncbi:MAG: secondary thiamine-phosphate synthase enzyme YjbQ [Opitutales bacterium]